MLTRHFSILLTLSLLPASAFAIDNVARVALNPNFSGGGGPIDDIHQGLGPQDASDSTTGGFNTTLTGTAHTDYSHVHLTGAVNGSGSAVTPGYIRDMLTINSPSFPTNTVGSLSYSVTISGALHSTSGSSDALYQLQTSLGGGVYNISRSGTVHSPELGGAFTGDPFGTYSATASFQFGQPFVLDLEYTGTISAGNSFIAAGEGDFDISLFWGGISGISVNNVPVTNATLSSDSGTHWLASSLLLGDANLDGKVDGADLTIVLNHFGATSPNWTDGNFDHAPTINLTHLSDVLNNFGQHNALPAAITPTPEPATLALALVATPLLLRRRSPH